MSRARKITTPRGLTARTNSVRRYVLIMEWDSANAAQIVRRSDSPGPLLAHVRRIGARRDRPEYYLWDTTEGTLQFVHPSGRVASDWKPSPPAPRCVPHSMTGPEHDGCPKPTADPLDEPVDWRGRTFGQLSPAEQRRAGHQAGAKLSAEMSTPAFAAAVSGVLDQPAPKLQQFQVRVYDEDGQLAYSRVEAAYSPMGAMIQLTEQRAAPDPRETVLPAWQIREPFGVPDPDCPLCHGTGRVGTMRCRSCPGDPAPVTLPGEGPALCGHRSRGRSECVMDAGHGAPDPDCAACHGADLTGGCPLCGGARRLHSDTVLLWDGAGRLCNMDGQPV